MTKNLILIALALILVAACTPPNSKEQLAEIKCNIKTDSSLNKKDDVNNELINEPNTVTCLNDTLNTLASIIAGKRDTTNPIYPLIQTSYRFKSFSSNFEKRWKDFDSSRIYKLTTFKNNELNTVVKPQLTLFYPFSGPDILYAQTFFPESERYIMIGLEPVGDLPKLNKLHKDSVSSYFNKINTSLNAILKYSFFRTESMNKDLKNTEVDGTLHLLFLFLKRTGNNLCSAKPITVDTLGQVQYINSFAELKKIKVPSKGIEINFTDKNNNSKTLYYYSLNVADGGLKVNRGFVTYLHNLGIVNTYLKGASYLMHKSYFSIIRNCILNQSKHVIQDDSGIALRYFTNSNSKWNYSFYGNYLKPIPLFAGFYQPDLDTLYKQQGSKAIGFGIGYNFKDKNSNFMIATKQN